MPIRPVLTYKERKDKIVEYVRYHPGCKMDDIVKALEKDISRGTIFKITPELVEEKIIVNKSRNKRDLALNLNDDNPLLRVSKEIDQFEKAYFNLLDKSKGRIENKDFSTVAKIIDLSSPDPQKWKDEDRVKYQKYEVLKNDEFLNNINKLGNFSNEMLHFSMESQNLLKIVNLEKRKEEKIKKLLELKNKFSTWRNNSEQLNYYFENLDSEEWAKGFECSIMMITSTKIFFLMSDTLFYRLTFIWSKNIQDKLLLQQLSLLVVDRISKINLKLSEFINSFKVLLPSDKYIEEMINSRHETKDFPLIMSRHFYKGLKMEIEIVEVIKSITVLDEELKKYRTYPLDFYAPANMNNESSSFIENFNIPETIDYLKAKINHFKKSDIVLTKEINKLINKTS